MRLYRIEIVRTFYIVAADAESAEDLAAFEPPNSAENRIRVSLATTRSLHKDGWMYVDAYGGPPEVPCHRLLSMRE